MKRGVTLIELLIAIGLTTIATFLILSLLKDESGHFVRTREKIRLQADARDAVRILEEELRNAGFATRTGGTGRIRSALERCPEVAFSGEGEALRTGLNGASMADGDGLRLRFYELPASGILGACGLGSASQFRELSYRLNAGRLERRYRDDTTTEAAWNPLLENVVSFQVRYGLLSQPVDTPSGMRDAALRTAANWTKFAAGAQTIQAGSGTAFVLSGFDATNAVDAHFNRAIDTTSKGEIYRCSFDAKANAAFLDAANGYDTTQSRLALVDALGNDLMAVNFRYPNVADVALHYDIFLTAPSASQGTLYLAFKNKLRAGASASAGQQVTLSDVSFRRVNRSRYFRWLSAPTSAEMKQVAAVRLNLLVKTTGTSRETSAPSFTAEQLGDTTLPAYTASGSDARRSHLLYERVIPVVNNAL